MDVDLRVAFVLLPIIAAASWALFNIAPAAIKQIQAFLNREAWTHYQSGKQLMSCPYPNQG